MFFKIKGKTQIDRTEILQEMRRTDKSFDKLEKSLKYQDKLYEELDKYCPNETLEETITRLEDILTPENIPLIHSQRMLLRLPDLYIKNGQKDKAWGFYNQLYMLDAVSRNKIRDLQAKLLKKEKKHKDAIEFFMLKRAEEYPWKHKFERDAFLKDIGVSVRALRWTEDIQNHIADIAEKYIANQQKMIKEYRNFTDTLK